MPLLAGQDDGSKTPIQLMEKTKKTLLEQGVQQNNQLMLSLTAINGVPVSRSPQMAASQSYGNDYDDDVLVYEPSEAQIHEID